VATHILPASFVALLSQFAPAFTAPSFANFQVLVMGFVLAVGNHRISDALRAVGELAPKHYTTYYRFFSQARWSLDDLGIAMLRVVRQLFGLVTIELVLDDTLARRTGKKVALASMHKDPLLSRGRQKFFSYGHVYVTLAIHVCIPLLAPTGWALPFMFRLYEGSRRGGRKDSPTDRRRAANRRQAGKKQRRRLRKTDQKVVEGQLQSCQPRPDVDDIDSKVRPTKTELAVEMLLKVARAFPEIHFYVLADHLYAGHTVLRPLHEHISNVTVITRGRPDAALYELPSPRTPGQLGRPRKKGRRLPSPEQWVVTAGASLLRDTVVNIYGQQVAVQVTSIIAMHYKSLPGRLMRYVIVVDPKGIYKTDYLFSTDPEMSEEEVIEAYSRRWPLERTFQECKQKLGLQDHQTQLPTSVRRCVPFTMFLYSLVVLWYVTTGRREAADLTSQRMPWQSSVARPSFSQMLASLRRLGWAQRILNQSHGDYDMAKITETYLAYMLAAA